MVDTTLLPAIERAIGDVLISSERYPAYLADKGVASVDWERACWEQHGSLVAANVTAYTGASAQSAS